MNRRLFIQASCGAGLSLPVFGSEIQKKHSSRLLILCNHLGLHMPFILPKEGNEFNSPYLSIFKKYHKRMTVVKGMTYKAGNGLHKSPRALLSGTANRIDAKYSPSIDQFLANDLCNNASFPSIVTRATDGWGISDNFSWGMNGRPVPAEKSPYALYKKLFKKYSKSEYLAERSVLDRLAKPISSKRKNLANPEKEKLDAFLSAVGELEDDLNRKLKISIKHPYQKPLPENLTFSSMGLIALRTQIEMSVYSMINNISNVCVTGITSGSSFSLNDKEQAQGNYHSLSHHGNLPEKIDLLKKVEMHQLNSVLQAIDILDKLPEGNGTMLDNTVVAIFAGHSNANTHSVQGRPVILIGGKLKHKGILDAKGANASNLLVTLCHAMGKPMDSYANSQGDFNGELL